MMRRKEVGSSLWLLCLLAHYTPDDWDGTAAVYVAGGSVISDRELSERLQVSRGTVRAWRCRLRKANLLRWTVEIGVGRVFIISAVKALFVPGAGAAIEQPATSAKSQEMRSAIQSRDWTH
jgi:DNA-binding FadR family transcriptional regulator